MELSVVIVSFNARDYLKRCLLSVQNAIYNIDSEIFVVDNNSVDGSAEMVRDEFPGVKLIANKSNKGFSTANNQAARQSSGEFILFLNPDTIVEENTFSKCIDFMKNHSDAGALGIRMVDAEGTFLPESKRALPTPATAFFKIFGLSFLFPGSGLFNRYYLPHINDKETSRVEVIAGAFMFMRREVLIKTGLLDEDYFMYGEDIELSYKLLKAGFNNYYFPEVRIVHYKGKSTSRNSYNDIHHFYRSMRIYSRKRNKERLNPVYFFIIPAIYFREGIALFNRFLKIGFKS
jgi:GT2 family glycosyltransferase